VRTRPASCTKAREERFVDGRSGKGGGGLGKIRSGRITSDGVVKHDVSEDLEQRLRACTCRRADNVVGGDDERGRWRVDSLSV
jgi:hypothetical protein